MQGILYIRSPHPEATMLTPNVKGNISRLICIDRLHLMLVTTEGIYRERKEKKRKAEEKREEGHSIEIERIEEEKKEKGNTREKRGMVVIGCIETQVTGQIKCTDLDTRRFEQLSQRIPKLREYRTMSQACRIGNGDSVLVATQNGIFVLDTACDIIAPYLPLNSVSRFSQKFNCLLRATDGAVWIGTHNGLLRVADGNVQRLTCADGLLNASIHFKIKTSIGHEH